MHLHITAIKNSYGVWDLFYNSGSNRIYLFSMPAISEDTKDKALAFYNRFCSHNRFPAETISIYAYEHFKEVE